MPDTPYTVEDALGTYDLQHFECFWEQRSDTKAVVGWSDSTVRAEQQQQYVGCTERGRPPALLASRGHNRLLVLAPPSRDTGRHRF